MHSIAGGLRSVITRQPAFTAAAAELTPAELIPAEALRQLNRRSDGAGWRQLAGHGALILASGLIWADGRLPWALRLPALLLLGWGLAFAFCALHECGHRTAFASRRLNDAVA